MLLMITSCGFHLRGMTEISFKTISLEGKELSFTKNLKKTLASNKVAIILPTENPELRIELLSEESEKRILSLSGQGLVREFEIFYRVRYRIKTIDRETWSQENIIETRRDFTFSDSNLIGKEEEERQLNESMRNEAITNLFNQIQHTNK
ncbi:LPS assembly lipoprotein LptE [Candidatus Methylopumilus rimovensis]|uniref:LPS-assembly lipoprotein LptE n=1 Tax=Candidatus Methylopumilus rimovensis TaxID=2588535 RepID=UPI001CB8D788|nr:LPS assembly lipoprotein LptE [Candidatus Methylopumilus rimovensis]